MRVILPRELAEKVFGLYLFAMVDNQIDLSTFKEDSIFQHEIASRLSALSDEDKITMIESLRRGV